LLPQLNVYSDPDAVIGSFAADHMISGDDAFLSAVAEAVEVARKDYLVTIGIAPSHPSTGFGYIRLGEKLNVSEAPNARIVSSFKEKPDARTAAAYIATGKYRWNAWMFVTKASFLMELLKDFYVLDRAGTTKLRDRVHWMRFGLGWKKLRLTMPLLSLQL
jgi:mannose-1-phosphate guanylyltransferase